MAVEAPSNAQWTSFEGLLTDIKGQLAALVTAVDALRSGPLGDSAAELDNIGTLLQRIFEERGLS